MPEITVNVEVWCKSCGAALNRCTVGGHYGRGTPMLQVATCNNCIASARAEGYDEGCHAGMALAEEDAAAE